MTEKLLIEKDGSLGWLLFNTPERRNAINLEMWTAIPTLLAQLNQDRDIRVILLRGTGEEAFVAGADISEFKELRNDTASALRYNAVTAEAFRAIRESPKPVIAMIRGFCMGGGCAIAINCDLRIASEDAQFSLPPAKLGIAYGADNVAQVVQVVGPAFAREMLYTARTYNAKEALRMGLIHHEVPVTELQAFTEKYARQLADNAPLAISAVKIAIEELLKIPEQRDSQRIADAMNRCFESVDYQEGYQAFLEKRKPQFQGR